MADWGSVPDWVEAVGTVMAFGGLVIGLLNEIRHRRAGEAERVEARARLVTGK